MPANSLRAESDKSKIQKSPMSRPNNNSSECSGSNDGPATPIENDSTTGTPSQFRREILMNNAGSSLVVLQPPKEGGDARHPPSASSKKFQGLSDNDALRRNFASGARARRTSLPASAGSFLVTKVQSNVGEASGIIADMLAAKDLPSHVVSCLKVVNQLLNPHPSTTNGGPHQQLPIGLPHVMDNNPFIGERLFIGEGLKTRSGPVTWSTVTSATGLSTIEPEPSRSRSSSFWKKDKCYEEGFDEGSTAGSSSGIDGAYAAANDSYDGGAGPGTSTQDQAIPSATAALNGASTTVNTAGTSAATQSGAASLSFASASASVCSRVYHAASDSTEFDLDRIEHSEPEWSKIMEWDLPIFQIADCHPTTLLTKLCYIIFREKNLFDVFKIPVDKFINFFHSLEMGYWDIPYVVHGVYYLTGHPLAAASDPESDDPGEPVPLSRIMSPLDMMALYTAAAMHDYDHPGKTNAFLVATGDPKAIMYNDRSVLENHHAASAWKLLNEPDNMFLDQLDPVEYKRFRYLVIELILATDLKRHFEILMEFKEKCESPDGLDWESESDKLLVAEVTIKIADINAPTKPYNLHIQWTNRITEEFYNQGDAESRLNLPVSPYMSRADPQLSKLQDSFIAHLVSPLVTAAGDAGLLPVLLHPTGHTPGGVSELIVNMNSNHAHWRELLPTEQEDTLSEGDKQKNDKGPDEDNEGPNEGGEMTTIQEQDESSS